MSEAIYALAETPHGPWWFGWTDAGIFASAQGELAESEFLDRIRTLGVSGAIRNDDADRPAGVDFSRVTGDFRRRVLEACSRIPEGQVRTYGQLAAEAGSPGAARAVGTAMAQNPVPGPVPCHRVVRGDGRLGQYSAGGTVRKHAMLSNEGVVVDDGRVAIRSS